MCVCVCACEFECASVCVCLSITVCVCLSSLCLSISVCVCLSLSVSLSVSLSTGGSTDAELLDLMLELAQTPVGTATQSQPRPSQSAHETQTVAHSLCHQLTQPQSSSNHTHTLTHSLTHPLTHPLTHSQPSTTSRLGLKTGFTCSQPVFSSGLSSGEDIRWRELLVPVTRENQSNEFDLIQSEAPGGCPMEKLAKPVKRGVSPHNESSSPDRLSKSPLLSDADLFEFSESALLSSSPRDDDIGIDPVGVVSVEGVGMGEGDLGDLSVMLNSSSVAVGNEKDDDEIVGAPELISQYDIPCGQQSTAQSSSPSPGAGESDALQDVLKESSHSGNLHPEVERSSVAMQLEFELPDISLSQFVNFPSTPACIPDSPSDETPHEALHKGVKLGDTVGVKEEIIGSDDKGLERVKESSDDASFSLVGSDPLSRSSSVAHGNSIAAVSSTQFERGDNWGVVKVAGERGASELSISLSSAQRRALLRQLSCAGCESGDLSDAGDDGDLSDVGEIGDSVSSEEEEWLSGDWNTPPITIPERCEKKTFLYFY